MTEPIRQTPEAAANKAAPSGSSPVEASPEANADIASPTEIPSFAENSPATVEAAPEAPSAKENLWQALKFTLFSISAGIIQLASFALLEEVFYLPYWPSYLIALILSVLWNFTFNRRYTFRSDANIPRAMALVALYYAVFTPLSTWWGHVLTVAGWNDFLVLAGTMIINFVTEYLFQRFVVYRHSIDTNDVARRQKERAR